MKISRHFLSVLSLIVVFSVSLVGCGEEIEGEEEEQEEQEEEESVESGVQTVFAGNGSYLWTHMQGEDDYLEETYIPANELGDLGDPQQDCVGSAGLELFPDDSTDAEFEDVGGPPWSVGAEHARFEFERSVAQGSNVLNVAWDSYEFGENDYVFHILDADDAPVVLDISWAINGGTHEAEGGTAISRIFFDLRLFDVADDCRELTGELDTTSVAFDDDGSIDGDITIDSDTSSVALWVTVDGRVSVNQNEIGEEEGEEAEVVESTAELDATFEIDVVAAAQ